MTLFQIVMLSLMGAGFLVALGFGIAFCVEVVRGPKTHKARKTKKTIVVEEKSEEEQSNIRKMLAQLEEESVDNEVVASGYQEPSVEPASLITVVNEDVIKQEMPVLVEQEVVEEVQEPVVEPIIIIEEEEPKQEVKVAPKLEELDDDDIYLDDEDDEEEVEETPKTIVIEKITTETVGTDFDYSVRLAKIIESKNKMERDLQKTKRAITKYERTQRRRTRNQKMLDRRAVELTNLNLMMYSVTDIKNVDADKKIKQEELTTHIAELKASIQDADIFLAKNKERYEHDKKMYAFYTKEEARYNDEIKELEILIKNANNVTGSTTTTTTTTTETV